MAEGTIRAERDGAIVTLTIVNPDRLNAMQPGMRVELARQVRNADEDPGTRALVIRGEGQHFCAGADFAAMGHDASPQSPEQIGERIGEAQDLVRAIALCSRPVIAAVEGAAYGSGLSLALACDYVVGAASARFGASFTRLGITAEFGLFSTLPRRIGHQAAKRMILFAEVMDGEEAARTGLSDALAADDGAFVMAIEKATMLAAMPPLAISVTKRAFAAECADLETSLAQELNIMPLLATSADFREAAAAFREKRTPRFTGR